MQCYSPNGLAIAAVTRVTYRSIGSYLRQTRIGSFLYVLEYVGLEDEMYRLLRISSTSSHIQAYSYNHNDIPDYNCAAMTFDSWKGNLTGPPALAWPGDAPAMVNPEPTNVFDIITSLAKKKSKYSCPLCKSDMLERTGKYGKFYACSAWAKTKCPGILNHDGKPNKKTLALIKEVIKSEKSKDIKDVEFTALDMLDV
jgi:hypothetical protein